MADDQKQSPRDVIQDELAEIQRGIKEITLMLEQSRAEVGKLTQRNAAITAHLQQVQNQAGAGQTGELRMAYDSALDAQQRLFVMRGQLEKLQSDQAHLERQKKTLEKLHELLAGSAGTARVEKGGLASVEMLVNAQESERRRLSRQMHDGPAQALSNFILQTEIAMRLLDVDAEQARSELSNLKIAAMGAFQKVRNFIFELRPMMLDDLGLVPTIRRYADAIKEQSSMDVNVNVSGTERRLEPYLEVMVFRAMQELISNATRHSQATVIKVQVDMGDHLVRLSVEDNGNGFDAEAAHKDGALGLNLIKERVEMSGGSFTVDSMPGKGARISLTVPAG
ncbi:MAG: sensor histidine kinase [Chloroflexi bacterium]|nr:sensor histidine kinase [Chloroflexota bacterium]